MARGEEVSLRYAMGIGARRGVAAQDVIDIARRVADQHGLDIRDLTLCALESKVEEVGIHDAARELGVALRFLPLAALRARKARSPTHSPRVQAMFGVGSVAEAAALVGAGPNSRLLAPRVTSPMAACAIAAGSETDAS